MEKYNKNISLIKRILEYCYELNALTERFGKSLEIFQADFAYRNACSMCILQIGELASRLSEEFRQKYNSVPWKLIKAMRNIFAHDYDNMNIEQTWVTIENDIPNLSAYCKTIIDNEKISY